MKLLMNNVPAGCYCEGFKPKLKSIRWESLYKCTDFVIKNMESYKKSEKVEVVSALKQIEESIGWNLLLQVLEIMWDMIQKVEKDLENISEIVPPFFEAYFKLLNLYKRVPFKLERYLLYRFKYTCPIQLPLFAYLMAREGLEFY